MELFYDMERKNICHDVFTYNEIIDGLFKEGNLNESRILFNDMQIKNICPTAVAYSGLIDGFYKQGKFKEAMLTPKNVHLDCHGIKHNYTSYSHHYFLHFDLHDFISTKYGPKHHYSFPINEGNMSIYCDSSPHSPKKGKNPKNEIVSKNHR